MTTTKDVILEKWEGEEDDSCGVEAQGSLYCEVRNSSPDEDHHSESLFSKPQLASMVLTRSQVSRLTSANLFFGELQLPTPTSDGAIG
ncbi:hypothetical protein ADUPG1_012153 [Aduncisulcus paluster]|uniref:Uncharacterized protein n=1 Tax=Aduncisulcus paluster TaxID=2918883 RepID=A0ABQ5K3A1_9EUKA|nr:hypothetical protein ADUPG1_012153 [Aduncisulcus paluster]